MPDGPIALGSWNLGEPVPTTERRLRELALAYVEAWVAGRPDLERFAQAAAVLGELERVLGFNLDVARGELETLRAAPLPPDVHALVSDMLFGAPLRLKARLEEATIALEGTPEGLRTRLEEAVTTALSDLRHTAVNPQGAELRTLRVREAVSAGRVLHAGLLERPLTQAARPLGRLLELGLGPGRLGALIHWLGIEGASTAHASFAPPRSGIALPQVYERLFGSQGLAGSGQIVGRSSELERARAALAAPLRSVALVGPAGSGTAVLAQAVWQRHGVVEPRLIEPTGPVRAADVDAWFADEPVPTELRGLGWLFDLAPGGSAALERLAAHLVHPARSTPWVLCADEHIWRAASRLAPLHDGVADVVGLGPLAPHQLREVLLTRHRMSAYTMTFEPEGLIANLPISLGPWAPSADERRQRAWFAQLHEASAGHLADAMRLWLAAVVQIDEEVGRLVVGPVPTPPLEALRTLHPRELAILRHVLRQGWVDVDLFARSFRTPPLAAQATLAKLHSRGLLHREQGRYFLATHLRRALGQVLQERGWAV